jgi:hypothetical protein
MKAICSGLLAWHRDAPRPPITDIYSTAANQDELDWQSLLKDCPASEWRDTQLAYYHASNHSICGTCTAHCFTARPRTSPILATVRLYRILHLAVFIIISSRKKKKKRKRKIHRSFSCCCGKRSTFLPKQRIERKGINHSTCID